MKEAIDQFLRDGTQIMEHLKREVSSIRAGRATPAIVEHISVDAYGSMQTLQQVATITTPDSRTIVIQPWDMGLMPAIQTAIEKSGIGMRPNVQDNRVLLSIPSLTQERREEYLKLLGKKVEETRIGVRARRDKTKSAIQSAEKSKTISEDEKFRFIKQLDQAVEKLMNDIERLESEKQSELLGK